MKHIATWIRECDEAHFERVFREFPEARLWNARAGSVPWEEVTGLLLTGGADISAGFLRQPIPDPSLIKNSDPARDAWEFESVFRALRRRLPLLAICNGFQVLNVALGGTLHLDVPNHNHPESKSANIQELRHIPGALFQFPRVNSSHHQALARPGAGLIPEAWCAADDVIEQARLAGYPFGLGVQYHPERDPLYQPIFAAFVGQVASLGN
ncbi:MAG TPA: gamma-glutamyl-gamma-aminobutyrate hydrolase family protein [Candidatus Methylacidiphilales bacterium]|nr:gamma-glutamyl-gamma-aminobutyrate hydrolase family protein [Candidatus Methylacidiphilales bacterium]